MEEKPQGNSIRKRIVILVVGLILIAVVSVGIVVLLRTILSPKPVQTDPAASSISEVIDGLKPTGAIKALENYQEQVSDSQNGQVFGTLDGKNYAISVPTKYNVLFFAKTPGLQNDSSTIREQIAGFMAQKGYKEAENTGRANKSENPVYSTYKSNRGLCQLASAQPTRQDGLAYHTISCGENTAFSQEYIAIENLLTLSRKEQQLPSFTQAIRTTITEDNKSLSLLNLNGDDNTLLLFAAIDANWEYIGDLGGGENSNGKYTISTEIRNKIDDVRWGNFLKKNLQ